MKKETLNALGVGAVGLSVLGVDIAVVACNKAKTASIKSVEAQVMSKQNLEVINNVVSNLLRRW